MLMVSKWDGLLHIDQPMFRELFLEFLTTFSLIKGLVAYITKLILCNLDWVGKNSL